MKGEHREGENVNMRKSETIEQTQRHSKSMRHQTNVQMVKCEITEKVRKVKLVNMDLKKVKLGKDQNTENVK